MKFVDYVTITVRSGRGGPGAATFRRAKYEPKGGPSGGGGGQGGSVVLEAADNLYTLLDLRYNRHHFAEHGQPGQRDQKTGKSGSDILLRVPPGTIARDGATGELIGELLRHGDRLVLAPGGRGGLGNVHFKSSTNQTPRYAQPGEPSVEREVTLELKLLADVGLVGFPNAGKSTLISVLSAARPKVADYPFTTLEPNLGMVYLGDYRSFVMADIPGLIEGASEGKGLGTRFLKHIERNAVLLFAIPADAEDTGQQYRILLDELAAFNPELLEKPRLLALTKTDLLPADMMEAFITDATASLPEDLAVYPVSAVAQRGLEPLKEALWTAVQQAHDAHRQAYEDPVDAHADLPTDASSGQPDEPPAQP